MPNVPTYLGEFVQGFSVLSTRRSFGFSGPNPIAMADILAYAKVFRIDDIERFLSHMISMDAAFITFFANRQKAAKNG